MQITEMKPIEMEPLIKYNFLMNDSDEVALELPGYYKGNAQICEFHYNGGEHGIFVRNKHQCMICDNIHPDLRQHLTELSEIVVFEVDTLRDYTAKVIIDDIDMIAEEAMGLHDYTFRLHPYPLMDGTFNIGDAECEFCGKKKGIYFKGLLGDNRLCMRNTLLTMNDDYPQVICPECIERGRENIDMFPNMAEGTLRYYRVDPEMVYHTTPPFFDRGKSTSFWPFCHGSAIYLGELEPEDITGPFKERLESNWKIFPTGWWVDFEPDDLWKDVENGLINAYLFRCAQCEEVFVAFNEYERV